MKLAQITPANRSTLPISTSQLFSSKDQLLQDNLVDLTADTSMHGHKAEHTFKALGLKKAKIMDMLKDAVCFDDGSTKLPQNVESRAMARHLGERSTPQSKKSTTEHACEKNDTVQICSEGRGSYSGPDFLKLVCCSFAAFDCLITCTMLSICFVFVLCCMR
jgi:regulator of telomere elongation helicase 1